MRTSLALAFLSAAWLGLSPAALAQTTGGAGASNSTAPDNATAGSNAGAGANTTANQAGGPPAAASPTATNPTTTAGDTGGAIAPATAGGGNGIGGLWGLCGLFGLFGLAAGRGRNRAAVAPATTTASTTGLPPR